MFPALHVVLLDYSKSSWMCGAWSMDQIIKSFGSTLVSHPGIFESIEFKYFKSVV